MRLSKNLTFLAIFSLIFLGAATDAHAIFTLTASPRRGGQGIRFEAGKPGTMLRNEEVTLTVTTDRSVKYQIQQIVYQPLTNEFGNVIPQGALSVFSPSSPLGNLRTQLETPVTMGQVPIFTSNASGESDSFVLAFNAKIPENQPGGVYHTTITFRAEPVNAASGVSTSVVNMDVRVDIRPDFRVTVQNVRGAKDLNFGKITKERPNATEVFSIVVESNTGSPYRLIQQLTEPLVSPEGAIIDNADLTFTATEGKKGTLKTSGSSVEVPESPVVLYTSTDRGEGDSIQIQYTLNPAIKQKAGIYSGNISFKAEANSSFFPDQIFNIPVRVEIEPVFYLDVEMEQGASNMHFGTFKSGDEQQEKRVLLTVHSNIGEPYQVSQIVSRKLTSLEGSTIPAENFRFYGSEAQTGILSVMSPTAVPDGESVVFTSNKDGAPEKFILNYSLTVPRESKAGNYNSDLKYSITTL